MSPKQWFLIKMNNGRPEIYSQIYDSQEDAMKDWQAGLILCETIYG